MFQQEGYQIDTIAPAPDGSSVVVSLITSSAAFVQALNSAQTLDQAASAVPHPELYDVPFDPATGSPRKLGLGGAPTFSTGTFFAVSAGSSPGSNGSSNASSGIAQCPGAPLSRLTVGGTGHVTPGTPNLIRSQPGGATIGSIPGGAAFSVLQGPTCTSDGIAWWQVNYNGTIGWTAEGQGTTYFLQP